MPNYNQFGLKLLRVRAQEAWPAVFWMKQPETLILVSLTDMTYLARGSGSVSEADGFRPFEPWRFETSEHVRIPMKSPGRSEMMSPMDSDMMSPRA